MDDIAELRWFDLLNFDPINLEGEHLVLWQIFANEYKDLITLQH